MPLTIQTYSTILRRMQNRTVARSRLSDLTDMGTVNQTLSAAAREDDALWLGIWKMRRLLDLGAVQGEDLDEWSKLCNPDKLLRDPAIKATGTVVFSRTGTTGTISIAIGTEVKIPSTGLQASRSYFTTAIATIAGGSHDSAAVAIEAAETGSSYNCDPGVISSFGSKPSGVDSVSNLSAITNGQDRETDDHYITRITLYRKSLSRGTHSALVSAALETVVGSSQIQYATAIEDEWDPGHVTIYVDDGGGTAETTTTYTDEVLIASAVGGEIDIYTLHKPIKAEAGFTLKINTVTKTLDVDYTLNPASGHVKLTQASYPNGLTAADAVTATYTAWTGLIAECQRIIDRDPLDLVTYPGVRAGGILVRVMAPQIVYQTVTALISVKDGFDLTSMITKVTSMISVYINTLGVGETLVMAEMIERCMAIPGMYNITFITPTEDQIMLQTQLARVISSAITVS